MYPRRRYLEPLWTDEPVNSKNIFCEVDWTAILTEIELIFINQGQEWILQSKISLETQIQFDLSSYIFRLISTLRNFGILTILNYLG